MALTTKERKLLEVALADKAKAKAIADKMDAAEETADIAAAVTSTSVMAKVLTGYTSVAGTLAAANTLVIALGKLDGNQVLSKATADSAKVTADSAYNGSFGIAGANAETSVTNGGAISVTKFLSSISTAGAETRTLAVAGGAGILKEIQMTVDGGDCTIALTEVVGARGAAGTIVSTTATFSAVGQTLILMSGAGGKWTYLGGSCVCT